MAGNFQLVELKSKGSKKLFLQGYVSRKNPDNNLDLVDELGQKAIGRNLSNAVITMDLDHEEWRNPITGEMYDRKKNKIPVAKVVDYKVDEEGTWVSAELNMNHPDIDSIIKSIDEGFLTGFSIAFKTLKSYMKQLGDKTVRVIQDLAVHNIGISGSAINQTCKFDVCLKSMSKKMAQEISLEDMKKELAELKSSFDKELESVKSENTELKSKYEELSSKLSEDKTAELKSSLSSQTDEFKKMAEKVTEQDKTIAELKSSLDKVKNMPINGAELKSQYVQSDELVDIDFKGLIQ